MAWQVLFRVSKVPCFDSPTRKLQQRRGVVGHVLHKAHNQRVATQTELLELHQAEDLAGQVGQEVVMETEGTQGMKPRERETESEGIE